MTTHHATPQAPKNVTKIIEGLPPLPSGPIHIGVKLLKVIEWAKAACEETRGSLDALSHSESLIPSWLPELEAALESLSPRGKTKEEILEIFRQNCVDFPGNYEVTPGQALKIADKLRK